MGRGPDLSKAQCLDGVRGFGSQCLSAYTSQLFLLSYGILFHSKQIPSTEDLKRKLENSLFTRTHGARASLHVKDEIIS